MIEGRFRQAAKAVAEGAAAGSGLLAFAGRRMRHRVLVLAYHNIVPDDNDPGGDRSLHLPLAAFRDQIRELLSTHQVVPICEALNAAPALARPRAVITFDDAYRGAVNLGAAELARLGLPATFFVAPGCLGGKRYWWDRFTPTGGWPEETRSRLLVELGGRDDRIVDWATSTGLAERPANPWLVSSSVAEIREILRYPEFSFAAHSWSHPNLASLEDAELVAEMSRPLSWLQDNIGSTVPWVAYPYGLSSSNVARSARDAGFAGGLLVSGGWWEASPGDPYALPRWNVPAGISLAGFRLRLAGFLFT